VIGLFELVLLWGSGVGVDGGGRRVEGSEGVLLVLVRKVIRRLVRRGVRGLVLLMSVARGM
jgi:hypothetical protein